MLMKINVLNFIIFHALLPAAQVLFICMVWLTLNKLMFFHLFFVDDLAYVFKN